jgi:hypothetical protein
MQPFQAAVPACSEAGRQGEGQCLRGSCTQDGAGGVAEALRAGGDGQAASGTRPREARNESASEFAAVLAGNTKEAAELWFKTVRLPGRGSDARRVRISGGAQRRLLQAVVARPHPVCHAFAHISDSTSACSSTVCVAFSCLSGG